MKIYLDSHCSLFFGQVFPLLKVLLELLQCIATWLMKWYLEISEAEIGGSHASLAQGGIHNPVVSGGGGGGAARTIFF